MVQFPHCVRRHAADSKLYYDYKEDNKILQHTVYNCESPLNVPSKFCLSRLARNVILSFYPINIFVVRKCEMNVACSRRF